MFMLSQCLYVYTFLSLLLYNIQYTADHLIHNTVLINVFLTISESLKVIQCSGIVSCYSFGWGTWGVPINIF